MRITEHREEFSIYSVNSKTYCVLTCVIMKCCPDRKEAEWSGGGGPQMKSGDLDSCIGFAAHLLRYLKQGG